MPPCQSLPDSKIQRETFSFLKIVNFFSPLGNNKKNK